MFLEACNYIQAGQAKEASQILEQLVSGDQGWDRAFQRLGVSYIMQVRKPLYKGAIAYWKNYEPQLDKITNEFENI